MTASTVRSIFGATILNTKSVSFPKAAVIRPEIELDSMDISQSASVWAPLSASSSDSVSWLASF